MTTTLDQADASQPLQTTATAAASPPILTEPYLDHPGRIAIIFGAFFLLCLPLALLMQGAVSNASLVQWVVITNVYSVLFGYTHFAVTFSLYLNSKNLEYFRSSPRNVVVYFVVPILILVIWFLLGYLGVNQRTPSSSAAFLVYLFWFFVLTKLADYLHVVRQSFGVLQLFKRHVPGPFPGWVRRAENAFFIVLLTMQMLTFKKGLDANTMSAARFDIHSRYVQLALAVAVLLFGAVLAGYVMMSLTVAKGRRRTVLLPFQYFLLQTASASLAIYWTPLYLAGLAMHYVEYHVVMYPRIFRARLEGKSSVDRLSLWLRSHKPVFYLVLIVFAYVFVGDGFGRLGAAAPASKNLAWLGLNLFNGIFLAHYFVEAFVWKFGVPFYRQELGPLYFPPPRKAAA